MIKITSGAICKYCTPLTQENYRGGMWFFIILWIVTVIVYELNSHYKKTTQIYK